jgi:GAF domain-containing protein
MYDPRVVDTFFALHASEGHEAPARSGAPVADPHATPMQAPARAPESTDAGSLEAFYDLGVAMAAHGALEDVGETLWMHLRARIGAAATVVLLYDEATDSLVPAFRGGDPTMAPDARIAVGDRLSGWVAATRQAIVNSDARLDLDPDVRDGSLLRSALAVPVCAGDRLAGVLAFYSDRAAAFTDVHQRVAEAAAHVVATHVPRAAAHPVAVARR